MKDLIRMNQLAGIITEGQAKKMMAILNESTLFPPNSISDFGNKHFDEIQNMFGKIRSEFQGTKNIKGIEVAFAGSDEDDGIDISFDPKFKKMSDVYNEIEPVKIAGKTIYVNNYLNSNLDDEDED
jgi:histidinol phosphatase-like PHP family hydrolase